MSKVWEHTLDEYEQSIKRSDTQGAAILRALLLPQLERPSTTVPPVAKATTVKDGNCHLCGEPMPQGEEMFNYHGYSGPCPKPPLPKVVTPQPRSRDMFKFGGLIDAFDTLPNDCTRDDMEALTNQINALRKWVEDYFEPCECPEPMLSKSNKCDFCGKEVKANV